MLNDLCRAASAGQARRPWFVLGEPGAGKSTLLERWFDSWAAELPEPRLGATVPVLVRLRELRPGDLDGDAEVAADRLWQEHGASSGAAWSVGRPTGESTYRADRCRAFRPVWLMDGLDELDEQLQGEKLFERLVVLPGAKVITCRTAVFETLRDTAEPHKEREFEILPLETTEEESFLAGVLEARGQDPARGKVIHKAVRSNAALRALAGNPLMLSLIVEVSDRMTLPATRAAFYREVVQVMWHRKLPRSEAERLLEGRDCALIKLAQQMALEHVEHALLALVQTSEEVAPGQGLLLREALERAGLLHVDPRRGTFRFLHLTFQEFFLARSLEPAGMRKALERYWSDARYEETLALLASLLNESEQATDLDGAVCWLLKWGSRTHQRDPRLLWQMRRSPLRVVLHLLRRAGVSWDELPQTASWLKDWLRSSPLGRLAVAEDADVPPDVLAMLARDAEVEVRSSVARNRATPPEVLAMLAHDADVEVRSSVAGNLVTPAEVFASLASDTDEKVRRAVEFGRSFFAENPSRIAGDPVTPPGVLANLACDANIEVRSSVARNSATPAEVLASLASDTEVQVRSYVAWNPITPAEALANLARDTSIQVRKSVGENPAASTETLTILMCDADPQVRSSVAKNRTTPAKIFAALATDADWWVRSSVAENPAAPVQALADLMHDDQRGVVSSVARNSATPAEMLAILGRTHARSIVAGNDATPPGVLAAIAREYLQEYPVLRRILATNRATPPEVLATLARNANSQVRLWVTTNLATPAETLAMLARDAEAEVRERALHHPNTLLEDLAPQAS